MTIEHSQYCVYVILVTFDDQVTVDITVNKSRKFEEITGLEHRTSAIDLHQQNELTVGFEDHFELAQWFVPTPRRSLGCWGSNQLSFCRIQPALQI